MPSNDAESAGDLRRWGRRRLLQTGATAFGGAGLGWTASGLAGAQAAPAAPVADTGPAAGKRIVPFHGRHQAGIATEPPQAALSLLGLDLRRNVDAEGLRRMLRLLTDDAARLTRGLPALADTDPELATLPARLTLTLGLGPRVVRDLLPANAGLRLDPLPSFRTDRLEDRWGQTDVAVQLCADDPITLAHARRMILKDTRAFASMRWVQDGFRHASAVQDAGSSMRNLMGQVDGTANPHATDADFDQVVWDERGGTTMVVRRIRMDLEGWDRVDRSGKELTIGRRLDSGAPLTGTRESDVPDLDATDDLGLPVIDPASHVARARDPRERILRRPYNYLVPDPERPLGEDAGLVFIAYQRDVGSQFVPIQRRLAEQDRLNQWTVAIGSAVYSVLPGLADPEAAGPGAPTYLGQTVMEESHEWTP